jgi:hypothetical protein
MKLYETTFLFVRKGKTKSFIRSNTNETFMKLYETRARPKQRLNTGAGSSLSMVCLQNRIANLGGASPLLISRASGRLS